MWVMLLDKSSSMGGPFEAALTESTGRVRAMEATRKWEAAKQSVLLQMDRLDEDTPVALFAFDQSVQLVAEGLAGECARFKKELEAIEPGGGTDIAAALRTLVRFAADRGQVPGALLISDGQSDAEAAKEEARRTHNAGIAVNVFVIDPTDEGVELAKSISRLTNGQFERITSQEKLIEATANTAQTFAQLRAQGREFVAAVERESQAVAAIRERKEELSFTAVYAAKIEREKKYPLTVYAHLASRMAEVKAKLRQREEAFGVMPMVSTASSAEFIARGKLLTVRPNIQHIFTNPPRAEVIWEDDIHPLDFQMRYAGDAQQSAVCSGFIDVSVEGMLISQIPVSIHVARAGEAAEPVDEWASARLFSNVFASYAREDEAIVRACREAYRLLGVHLWVDTLDLASGEVWRDTIREVLTKQDLFQLYWSCAAAVSTNVAREYELARVIAKSREYPFIRPLFWEADRPELPADLSHLNFARLDLSHLRIARNTPMEREPAALAKRLAVTFPVLALEAEATDAMRLAVQEAMGQAVPYLEELTGLRYYPPATLLVDEFVVKQVRQVLTVDAEGNVAPESPPDLEWSLAVLKSLGLVFHVGRLNTPDGESRTDSQLQSFYQFDDRTFRDFQHIVWASEGDFINRVGEHLKGTNVMAEAPTRWSASYPPATLGESGSFVEYARGFFGLWLECADRALQRGGDIRVRNGFSLPMVILDRLRSECPDIAFEVLKEEEWGGKYPWIITLANYRKAVATLAERVLVAIEAAAGVARSRLRTAIVAAPTYGIFANASVSEVTEQIRQYVAEQGWPAGALFPDAPKVLLSANALQRYERDLLASGKAQDEAKRIARWFLESTLVHEHFHGILETGLDDSGRPCTSAEYWEEWEKGLSLNESLAAWTQWHFFRDNAEMFAVVGEYIRYGDYPTWPYRGAESIEQIYLRDALPQVRRLIEELRRDPEVAQTNFEALRSGG